MRGTDSVAEIAQGRQAALVSLEAPVWMEPNASGRFDGLTAMEAGQHESILTPVKDEGVPVFASGSIL